MIEVRVSKSQFDPFASINLYVRGVEDVHGNRIIYWPTNKLNLEVVKEDFGIEQAPIARLEPTAAQQLIDDLWRCGLRPSEGTGSAGSFAAQKRHLDDMRAIVAKKLEVQL